jgi:hypothetical protein
MARSMKSQISVGNIRAIWNATFGSMDYYKKAAKGKFILCNPYTGKFIQQGPGLVSKQLDRLIAK